MPIGTRVILYVLCLPLVAGCGNDPNIPQVVYSDDLPQPPPDHLYDLPVWRVGEASVEFSLPDSAQAGWRLGFDGGITAGRVEDLPHSVLIFIREHDSHGEGDFVNSGGTVLQQTHRDGSLIEPEDGVYRYHVEMQGPKNAGTYSVTLFFSSPNSSGAFGAGQMTGVERVHERSPR